jgi:CheY-like chemotaxis protein
MSLSILIVEDEPLVAHLVEDALLPLGHCVHLVPSGDLALERLRQWGCHVDVLVTDVRMPGAIDGWALARRAKECLPNLAVIYMTGNSMLSWSGERVAGSLIFQKPFVISSLVSAINRCVASPVS